MVVMPQKLKTAYYTRAFNGNFYVNAFGSPGYILDSEVKIIVRCIISFI